MIYAQKTGQNSGVDNRLIREVDYLRSRGVSENDITVAISLQNAARANDWNVLSLAAYCGLEQLDQQPPAFTSKAARMLAQAKRLADYRGKGGTHITRRPVWANSVRTGSADEVNFAKPMTGDMKQKYRNAAWKLFERGRVLASEGRAGRELSDEEQLLTGFIRPLRDLFLRIVDELHFRKGWCIPSYETLARWTGQARRTIHYHLNALKRIGLLDWIRRYEYSRDDEFGARSEQTSNLYRCEIPQWAARAVGIDIPPPDDARARLEAAQEDHATMLADIGAWERRRLLPDNPEQRAALILAAERLARRETKIEQDDDEARECNSCTPPHYDLNILDGIKGMALDGP